MESKNCNKKKSITLDIIAVIIAILSLTIGYMAFSNQIKIDSNSMHDANIVGFKIIFSPTTSKTRTNIVNPILSSNGSKIDAQNAIIDNTSNPKITNMMAKFTEPGQKVTYSFYVYNEGEYIAYLNSIVYNAFNNSDSSKICMTKDNKTNDKITEACNNIRLTVKIDDIYTSHSLYNIRSIPFKPLTFQEVEVTIEYLPNAIKIEEPFDVIYGNIELIYTIIPYDN